MAPRTRRQHATAETAPVAHSTNTSMHAVSSKKKKKGVDTHQPNFPRLVLKGPWPKVTAAESEVSLGKHALSPEEGPTSDVDQRRATPGFPKPKPAKRVKAGDTWARPPHLELTDDEETPSNVPPNHVRKLRRTETLMIEDDDDSVHDKFSSGTETKSSESESNEEEECDDLVGLTQTAKMSKMAFEASISYFRRPSWLANSAEDITDTTNIGQTDWHHSPPNSVPACIPSTHGTLPPRAQAGAHVLSGGLTGIQPEDSQTTGLELMDTGTASEGQQMTCTHSVYPQVTVSGTKGTTSEGPQATHMRSEGHSEGRQAARMHSMYHPVTVSRLKGTTSEGRPSVSLYPDGYPQVFAPGFTGTTPKGQTAAHAHSKHHRATASGFAGATSEGQHRAQTHSEHPQAAATSATRQWPVETNMCLSSPTKAKLRDQTEIHAFPDLLLANKFIQEALITASLNTNDADDIHVRLFMDRLYCSQMSILPRARISVFRADVKERCVAATTLLLGAHDLSAVTDLVKRLLTDFNYIFPRRNVNGNILVGSPHLSHPYHSSIIISVIQDLYFSGNKPFVTRHQDQFPFRQGTEGDVIWEVPKAMVGLVATAYYATLSEWGTGKRRQQDFTANIYLDAYNSHVNSLIDIEKNRKVFYHNMMAEIYQLASNGGLEADSPSESLPATLDLSMLED
ncbi:hypothetical protein EDB83DRAFT_2669654 [Lactarius deliciosus]|nr:hypothetical protein EDB83DRAFT_2669654 [Lactarius deliciosus]